MGLDAIQAATSSGLSFRQVEKQEKVLLKHSAPVR
jgi:hypothetical protein